MSGDEGGDDCADGPSCRFGSLRASGVFGPSNSPKAGAPVNLRALGVS